MARGLKWWNNRDIEGNLPDDITRDPAKMVDVNYYLENTKSKEIKAKPKESKK
jgi:hypothetical protein